jgi:hypothetical protein
MDDREKKLLAQLDDPMAGQRTQALEMLHAHDEKNQTSFRDRVAKIERGEQCDALEQEVAALRPQIATLDAELTQYKAAISQWQRHVAVLKVKLAVASAIAWGRTTGRRLAAYAALPLIGLVAWQGIDRYWPVPSEVASDLRNIATAAAWGPGCAHPFVRQAGGRPYWVLICGRSDTTSDLTADGRPIGLHCIDLYASAAKPDWQEYVKADPYGPFGLWIQWPKRAEHCQPFDIKEAQK